MTAWIRHNWLSLSQTAARLAGSPLATLLNVMVIGVALALPLGGYVLLDNLRSVSGEIATEPQISVFLASGADKRDAAEIEKRLRANPAVRSVQFIGRDQALAGLRRAPGLADVVGTLRENPLPDALVATLTSGAPELASNLEKEIQPLRNVAHVQVDSAWIRRVDSVVRFGRTIVMLLAALLGFALVTITFNTIRLQILTRRDEIEISRLIGATDAYIRRPFYYLAVLQSIMGGVVALAIVQAGIRVLNGDLSNLSGLFGADYVLGYLGLADGIAVVVFAGVLGLAGAHLSVSKHLHEIGYG